MASGERLGGTSQSALGSRFYHAAQMLLEVRLFVWVPFAFARKQLFNRLGDNRGHGLAAGQFDWTPCAPAQAAADAERVAP